MAAAKSFPQILVESATISTQQLSHVQTRLPQFSNRVSSTVISLGFATSERIAKLIAQNYGLPLVDLSKVEVSKELTSLIKKAFCEKFFVVPLVKTEKGITFAFSDPNVLHYKPQMETLLNCQIELVVAREEEIKSTLERTYETATQFTRTHAEAAPMTKTNIGAQIKTLHLNGDENSVQFIDKVLAEATSSKASDIHFEQFEARFRVRFRVDGQMIEVLNVPGLNATEVVSRIKVLARMDVSEKRHPQDGRIKFRFREENFDMRVSVIPTLFGEKVVIRILDKKNVNQSLSGLGISPLQSKIIKKALAKTQGLVLVTGPTGSGKTTTLYAALLELNSNAKNISTAEDPVEFNLDGINQVQINSEIGFTFAEALRSFLRQDPDVIMVGEIRDLETATMCYKAASTGHLVLSTLHTNDAISAVSRLIDMGVPKFLVAESTTLVTAQRLLKKLCTQCRVPRTPSPQFLKDLGVSEEQLDQFARVYEEKGCAACNQTGYKGRVALHELLEISTDLREAIVRGESAATLKEIAIQSGFITLRMQALLRLQEGTISLQEVLNSTLND